MKQLPKLWLMRTFLIHHRLSILCNNFQAIAYLFKKVVHYILLKMLTSKKSNYCDVCLFLSLITSSHILTKCDCYIKHKFTVVTLYENIIPRKNQKLLRYTNAQLEKEAK